VSFRSQHPDEATKKEVQKILQDNDIYVSEIVEIKTDHCQQAESSRERGSSA
jgi:hypothetical protein